MLYRQRHEIENILGRLKGWRRIRTRYDRCAHIFMSAICIAATIIFWLTQGVLILAIQAIADHDVNFAIVMRRPEIGGI